MNFFLNFQATGSANTCNFFFFFCNFEKKYNDWIKSFSKSKWTGLKELAFWLTYSWHLLFQTNVTSQEPRHIISGLAPGAMYEIRVMTETTKGNSPFSDVLSVITKDQNETQIHKLIKSLGIDIMNMSIVSIIHVIWTKLTQIIC